MTTLIPQLYAALQRVVPYLDYLPPTAQEQIREALAAYELAQAEAAIVQKPGKAQCNHEAFARDGSRCAGCGMEL